MNRPDIPQVERRMVILPVNRLSVDRHHNWYPARSRVSLEWKSQARFSFLFRDASSRRTSRMAEETESGRGRRPYVLVLSRLLAIHKVTTQAPPIPVNKNGDRARDGVGRETIAGNQSGHAGDRFRITGHRYGRKKTKVDPIERRELSLGLHEDDGNLIDEAD
jgi:hypothetical protein